MFKPMAKQSITTLILILNKINRQIEDLERDNLRRIKKPISYDLAIKSLIAQKQRILEDIKEVGKLELMEVRLTLEVTKVGGLSVRENFKLKLPIMTNEELHFYLHANYENLVSFEPPELFKIGVLEKTS